MQRIFSHRNAPPRTEDSRHEKFRSHWFCVAVEGATTDKRTIKRAWLEQAAKNFNPATYGARIWLEHFRSLLPDSPFKAYGDVLAVKADEIDINGQKKLALFAQVEPTPELIALNKAKQKSTAQSKLTTALPTQAKPTSSAWP